MAPISLRFAGATLGAALVAGPALADPMLADFTYPHRVERYDFQSQGQALSMAYMDIAPGQATKSNGKTVVLLHGKNFCGAPWEGVIPALRDAGYRVVVPDQIGFCKSSKPEGYQFGLHQLAANTRALLDRLKVEKPIVMGHSMGGMLAMRYALMYPRDVGGLVLVNPIGLEDWKAKGVPLATVDELYASSRGPASRVSRRTSRARTMPGNGSPSTTAGWPCWPACTRAKVASAWPGTRRRRPT